MPVKKVESAEAFRQGLWSLKCTCGIAIYMHGCPYCTLDAIQSRDATIRAEATKEARQQALKDAAKKMCIFCRGWRGYDAKPISIGLSGHWHQHSRTTSEICKASEIYKLIKAGDAK